MRPDNTGLKISMIGWIGAALSIIAMIRSGGSINILLIAGVFPLIFAVLFAFTKKPIFGITFSLLFFFSRIDAFSSGSIKDIIIVILALILFVYAIWLAIMTRK